MPFNSLKRMYQRLQLRSTREHQVGRHTITLPPGHRLDVFQHRWKRYDKALGEIASVIQRKYPDLTAIDIGANIGDSAALICRDIDVPVLCIEGNKTFLPALKGNLARLGLDAEIEESFVGAELGYVADTHVNTKHGTAFITKAGQVSHDQPGTVTKRLSSIVDQRPRFALAKLLKIDTDGFDFSIIHSAADFIESARPVVFFEYILSNSEEDERSSLAAIDSLVALNYKHHLVYDNFGNFMISVTSRQSFVELNTFLRSNIQNGTAIHYLDVCSFHDDDIDLFEDQRHREIDSCRPQVRKSA